MYVQSNYISALINVQLEINESAQLHTNEAILIHFR